MSFVISLIPPVVAIAAAIYTEKVLVPLASDNYGLKLAVRMGYINWTLNAFASLLPVSRWIHVAFLFLMLFLCFRIIKAGEKQIEYAKGQIELRNSYNNFWAKHYTRKGTILFLKTYGCPAQYQCEMMGGEADGFCQNYDICQAIGEVAENPDG